MDVPRSSYPARSPTFASMAALEFPLLRGGQVDGRTVLVGYHPTYARRKRVGAEVYAARIVETIKAVEGGT